MSWWMAPLGGVVLLFLILHLSHIWVPFRFGSLPEAAGGVVDLQSHVEGIFQNPWVIIAYALGILGVGAHLFHGIGSAGGSLGVTHNRLRRGVRFGGRGLAVVMVLGFMTIPVVLYLRG